MEMEIWNALRPICIDIRHVHPWCEGFGERVEESIRRLIDSCDAQNIVNIRDDREASGGHKERGCVSSVCAVGIDI